MIGNADVVKDVYEKFGQGDAASILARFDPEIEFRLAEGHPYQPSGQPWFGKDAVTQHFFMKAGPEWERWSVVLGEYSRQATPWWSKADTAGSTSQLARRSMFRSVMCGSFVTARSRASISTLTPRGCRT